MKQFRLLPLLALTAAIVFTLPAIANASTIRPASIDPGAHAAAVMPAGVVRPAASAVIGTNYIVNLGSVGLGTIHLRDGVYTHGTYDAILPTGYYTDLDLGWTSTAGWYTGPGYCTYQWRSDNGGPFVRQLPDLGPGQHFIGDHTTYEVFPYKATTCISS